jgi:probable phosphoglycerate mutase
MRKGEDRQHAWLDGWILYPYRRYTPVPWNVRWKRRKSLGETNYGELTGKAMTDILKTDMWKEFQAHPSRTRFPGAETIYEVQVRVVAELEELLETHPQGNIAIVSHADAIRVAVAYYIGLPLDLVGRIWVTPASLSILRFDEGEPRLTNLSHTGSLEFLTQERDSA